MASLKGLYFFRRLKLVEKIPHDGVGQLTREGQLAGWSSRIMNL